MCLRPPAKWRRRAGPGFTLVELVAAIAIVAVLLAVAVPSTVRFYESIQYKQAIREVVTVLASARYQAINSGEFRDVLINPESNLLQLNERVRRLPSELRVVVHSAAEINRDAAGVIRFYPEGGSSGGDIEIAQPSGAGVKISVDWLAGTVSQQAYAFD